MTTHDKGKVPTKERLAQALHSLGLFDLEARARAAEFSDFEGPHALPKYILLRELVKKVTEETKRDKQDMLKKLTARVVAGEFDDSAEEAKAWARENVERPKRAS